MLKKEAKSRLAGYVAERVGYKSEDDWGKHDLLDIEAAFELSHTGSYYYPDRIKSLTETVYHFEMQSWHDDEDEQALNELKNKMKEFCDEHEIEIEQY